MLNIVKYVYVYINKIDIIKLTLILHPLIYIYIIYIIHRH